MATNLGTAYVSVMPSMKGFGSAVESGLNGIDTKSAGKSMGEKAANGFAGGMASQGVIIGAASALASKAFDAVSASAGRAISRVDTMNNFPKIMANMNVGADEAEAAISKLSDKLTGLPTALDAAVSSVQRFTLKNGDLSKSTDMFLAVNDAILAGGQSMGMQQSALEQLSQAYSKGQMDTMEWRTLQQAMPAQLKQVAESMGYSIEELGAGLRHAKQDVNYVNDISMDDFIAEIMRLDTEGVNGMKSFAEQAKTSTAGIQTSMANFQTAIVRGVANVIDAIGQENISGAVNFLGSQIGGIFKSFEGDAKAFANFMTENKESIMGFVSTLADLAPTAVRVWTAFKLFQGGRSLFNGIMASVDNLAGKISTNLLPKMGSLGTAISGLSSVGIVSVFALAASAAGLMAMGIHNAIKRIDDYNKSTTGLTEATSRAVNILSNTKGAVDDLSEPLQRAARDWDAFWDSQAKYTDNINTIIDSAESEVISLNSAQSAIEELAGKSDLTTQEQGRLSAALDIVNEALGTNYQLVDAANGVISDSAGEYDEAAGAAGEYKDAVLAAIDAKQKEIRLTAMQDAISEAWKKQADAQSAYSDAVYELAMAEKAANENTDPELAQGYATAVEEASNKVARMEQDVRDTANAVNVLEENLGSAMNTVDESASKFESWANESGLEAFLKTSGHSVAEFKDRLDEVGISVDTLADMSDRELATLANSFDGSGSSIVETLSSMGLAVDDYNAKQLLEKLAEVEIDDQQLLDAQGNVYTWNETGLIDKDGNVVTEDKQLIDSQGRLWIWNSTNMKWQDGHVTVSGAESIEATKRSWDYWEPLTKTGWFNIRTREGNASGGFFSLHSSGGFITDGPVTLGKDRYGTTHIAGEDGREWVKRHADGTTSIIPIENRHYLKPYASVIASMLENGGKRSAPVIYMNLNYDASDDAQSIFRDIEHRLEDYLALEA